MRHTNRYGRERSYYTNFEGVVPYIERRHREAETDTSRDRFEGFMREVPCPACQGTRLKPVSGRSPWATRTRAAATSPRSARCRSTRPPSSSPTSSSPTASARSPSGCSRRSRSGSGSCSTSGLDYLSLDRPSGDPLRRRGAAHPPGHPDRRRPGRRALRARRAQHRAAPARQQAADRDARPAQGPRQHPDRGRARRGDDQDRRLGRRHRPGRRRARRSGRPLRARSSSCSSTATPRPGSTCPGRKSIPVPDDPPTRRRPVAS